MAREVKVETINALLVHVVTGRLEYSFEVLWVLSQRSDSGQEVAVAETSLSHIVEGDVAALRKGHPVVRLPVKFVEQTLASEGFSSEPHSCVEVDGVFDFVAKPVSVIRVVERISEIGRAHV